VHLISELNDQVREPAGSAVASVLRKLEQWTAMFIQHH
jgi:hypothetical protein